MKHPKPNIEEMKSYLKFLLRNKLYTAIEAVGLTVSVAFVVLIGSYVWQHYRLAVENPVGKSVYTVLTDGYDGLSWWDKASFEEQVPEVEAACRLSTLTEEIIRIGDRPALASVRYADVGIFDFFPHVGLSEGSLDAFAAQGNCLVSESFARAHFDGDALGKQLTCEDLYLGDSQTMTVCGVYRDFDNTMIGPVDILLNAAYDSMSRNRPFGTRGQYLTLVKAAETADRGALTGKLQKICGENYHWIENETYPVVRLDELAFIPEQYFVRNCNPKVLRLLTVVVLLLLLSALFNYVNLNTALSGRRAKEMAMRRLLGSQRPALFGKYIAESVLFTLVCTALALLLAEALRPVLDTMLHNVSGADASGEEDWHYLPLRIDWSAGALAAYAFAAVAVGIVAGLTPAVMAMRYKPVDVVRGTFRRRTKMVFSRIFIVIQNIISVALITLALVMECQMHHMLTRPIHSRTDGLYYIRFMIRQYDDVRPLVDRLEQIPGIGRIGLGNGVPSILSMSTPINPFNDPECWTMAGFILCDETFFDLLELEITTDFAAPHAHSVWMAESLVNELSLTDSLQTLQTLQPRNLSINGARPEVYGGIYCNFPTEGPAGGGMSPHSIVIVDARESIYYANGLLIEVTGDRRAAAAAIRRAYADYMVERFGLYSDPDTAGYMDNVLADQLRPQRAAMRLVEIFMILSVLISLLGLVAISTYFAGENTKSIAIRKVFGSNVRRELWRTVSGYMALVATAAVIGIPVAVRLAGRFLEKYSYRIEGYWWIFVVAAALSVGFAFASVFWQTWRAARTNPATELKKE